MIDVALASCDAYLDLHPDDRILREALHERGLTTTVVSWTDEAYDWSGVRCCLPRNTWDYPERPADFYITNINHFFHYLIPHFL